MDEREKEELAKKIKEQRRAVWKGETKSRNQKRARRDFTTARRISDQDQGREKVRLYLERQQEKESVELSFEQPSDIQRMKRKSRDSRLKVPALKLALLVIIGLIAAILLGVGIGYLVAVRNWISI
jgi:Flp pilus assembly protein TadB